MGWIVGKCSAGMKLVKNVRGNESKPHRIVLSSASASCFVAFVFSPRALMLRAHGTLLSGPDRTRPRTPSQGRAQPRKLAPNLRARPLHPPLPGAVFFRAQHPVHQRHARAGVSAARGLAD